MDSLNNNTCPLTNLAAIAATNLATCFAVNLGTNAEAANSTYFDQLPVAQAHKWKFHTVDVVALAIISLFVIYCVLSKPEPYRRERDIDAEFARMHESLDRWLAGQPGHNPQTYRPRTGIPLLRINTLLGSAISHRPANGPVVPVRHVVPAHIEEIMDALAQIFKDVPFAISGRAALSIHGYAGIMVPHVTMLCQEENVRSVQNWVRARGLPRHGGEPFSFTMTNPRGAAVVCVRSTNEDYWVGFVGKYDCPMLDLPTLANRIAKAYIGALQRGADMAKQEAYKQDICWVLHQISRAPNRDQAFTEPGMSKWLMDPAFWEPFTASFPTTMELFAAAGLDLHERVMARPTHADVGAPKRARMRNALRSSVSKARRRLSRNTEN